MNEDVAKLSLVRLLLAIPLGELLGQLECHRWWIHHHCVDIFQTKLLTAPLDNIRNSVEERIQIILS